MPAPDHALLQPPRPEALDRGRVQRALSAANLPTLVMVLFQLTGDERWLEDPYRPTRTKGLDDHDSGGFSDPIQHEIREAAVNAILDWAAGQPPAVPQPDRELLVRMMSICMGEPVPAEYGPMMAEEMGFAPVDTPAVAEVSASLDPEFSVVIIGAGVSGLTAAAKLKQAGIEHVVLEKNHEVGGTWVNNRYPGAGVDTPSFLYAWSFFPRKWSTYFGKRDELATYVKDMARHFDLYPSIRFGTEVVSAIYDEDHRLWRVSTVDEHGRQHELVANAVITAVGQLNQPKVPDLPGADSFGGRMFHSARWPDDLDITGKRVAVVGTGASAMQIVPAIADRVEQLTIFQRSPQWVAPVDNYFEAVSEDVHWLMEHVPFYHAWYRFRLAWSFNDKPHASLQIDPDWPHQDRSINAVNDKHREYFTKHLMSELEGSEDLQQKALPDYPPFGKRMLLDNGWYRSLRKPNVELIDEAVAAVTEDGPTSESGQERAADVIVLATGFQARQLLHSIDVRGRDGRSIRDHWGHDDARAYLGVTTPGFPNLFLTYGPNTNLGHGGSYFHIVECQVRYIMDLIAKMLLEDVNAVECRTDVHDKYNRRVDEAHERMIWSHTGMDTWYRNERGRIVTNAPWRVVDYWSMTHEADLDDFHLERSDGSSVDATSSSRREEPAHAGSPQ